ncbi:MAG TPA: diguanylate cyclase, partial [Planctomycetota bacterium]|nr:diguanylate cyclase [Planctomycetota bacterium]
SNDAVVGKDLNGIVLSWNHAAERLFGFSAEEMVGHSIEVLFPPERLNEHMSIMEQLRRGIEIGHYDTERVRKDGTRIHVSITISPIDDGSGHLVGASSVARDITEQKKAEAQIRYLAHHDALTGLPNRLQFREHLSREVSAAAIEGRRIAVLFFDLDRFKEVNDTHGHDIGDQLLRTVAQRIEHCLRTGDLVARLGGDEFVAVLGGQPTLSEAQTIAEKVLDSLRAPMCLMDQEISISASVGISLFPDDGASEDALLVCADKAMYQAKQDGRNKCYSFQPTTKISGQTPEPPQQEPPTVHSSSQRTRKNKTISDGIVFD